MLLTTTGYGTFWDNPGFTVVDSSRSTLSSKFWKIVPNLSVPIPLARWSCVAYVSLCAACSPTVLFGVVAILSSLDGLAYTMLFLFVYFFKLSGSGTTIV